MAWVQRANRKRYFYLSKRMPDGSVKSTYFGRGRKAIIESKRLHDKELQHQTVRLEQNQIALPEKETKTCIKQLTAVYEGCLLAAGLHNPKGRGWRWKRGSINPMAADYAAPIDTRNIKSHSDFYSELELLLKSARRSNQPAIHRLGILLKQQPNLLSDLMRTACRAQIKWIYLIAGSDLYLKEITIQQIKKLKGNLSDEGHGTNLEELLIEQILLCYLQFQYQSCSGQQFPNRGHIVANFRQCKINSAAKSYTKSLITMTTFNKLFKSRNRNHLQGLIQ